jgi:hypothetical protein
MYIYNGEADSEDKCRLGGGFRGWLGINLIGTGNNCGMRIRLR